MKGDHPGGPIRWRLHVGAPPERVYEALTTDEGRAAFWAESAQERDGAIHFHFMGGQATEATILERRPPQLFSIRYFGSTARFDLTPDGSGGTDLLLTNEDVPVEDWQEVHAGWLNVLLPLKAWLTAGIDLRNHDPARTWNEGYADQ